MTATGDVDPARIGKLHATELARFRQARPRTLALIARARAHMPNGATGGTLFGNPLSAAAAKAALTQVLVPAAYAHTTALGRQLADGIDHAIQAAGLPWTVIRLGPRSGQWHGPMPRTGAQAHALTDDTLTRLTRVWMANRGIWDALPGAGPTVPVPATPADVTRYLDAYSELLAQLR